MDHVKMPNRILKPGINSSERFSKCSLGAQVTWFRLLTIVDDFGRVEFTCKHLKSYAFTSMSDEITCAQMISWIQELIRYDLIVIYRYEDKEYLSLNRWDNKPRAIKSKCPDPSKSSILRADEITCSHLLANARLTVTVTDTVTVTERKNKKKDFNSDNPYLGTCLDTPEFSEAWNRWVIHRNEIKHKLTPTTIKAQIKKLEAMGHDDAIKSINRSIENGWIGLFEPTGSGQNDNDPCRPKPDQDAIDYGNSRVIHIVPPTDDYASLYASGIAEGKIPAPDRQGRAKKN